jgi:hypothetical protein
MDPASGPAADGARVEPAFQQAALRLRPAVSERDERRERAAATVHGHQAVHEHAERSPRKLRSGHGLQRLPAAGQDIPDDFVGIEFGGQRFRTGERVREDERAGADFPVQTDDSRARSRTADVHRQDGGVRTPGAHGQRVQSR